MKKLLFCIFIGIVLFTIQTQGQTDILNRLKDKVIDRVDQNVEEGMDNAIDDVENDIKNPDDDKNKTNDNSDNNNGDDAKDQKNNDSDKNKKTQPNLESYSKFDFIPGEKVIFFEDFASDAVGDFPASWNTNGSGEIMTTNLYPGKWFAMRPNGYYTPEVKIGYPENFTLEFDFIMGLNPEVGANENLYTYLFRMGEESELFNLPSPKTYISMWSSGANSASSVENGEEFFTSSTMSCDIFDKGKKFNEPVHVSVWIQKQRLRLYLDNNKILDLPKCLIPNAKYDRIIFSPEGSDNEARLIANIRVAEGLPDLRNKIFTDGKIVSYGILFDSGKDAVKPESYGTLKEIGQLMKDNPTLKLKIVGHTDADGADATNLDLSKRRAASVKSELSKVFGVEASRLETDGKGESEPLDKGTTSDAKAKNRRVEFIKI